MSDHRTNDSSQFYRNSRYYEQLVEHVFISEVLQEVLYSFGKTVEVLRSEVDAFGYDVVFECNCIMKTTLQDASVDDRFRGYDDKLKSRTVVSLKGSTSGINSQWFARRYEYQ